MRIGKSDAPICQSLHRRRFDLYVVRVACPVLVGTGVSQSHVVGHHDDDVWRLDWVLRNTRSHDKNNAKNRDGQGEGIELFHRVLWFGGVENPNLILATNLLQTDAGEPRLSREVGDDGLFF